MIERLEAIVISMQFLAYSLYKAPGLQETGAGLASCLVKQRGSLDPPDPHPFPFTHLSLLSPGCLTAMPPSPQDSTTSTLVISSSMPTTYNIDTIIIYIGTNDIRAGQSEVLKRLPSTWLKDYCAATGIPYINNFDLFWARPILLKHDGLHPNRRGSQMLSVNIDSGLRE
ncbi:hypothetical protein SKAU_G00208740 [Synaphobranchus kaupii]|uniref:SGNH hydrolase-type esterase domain-containing protein n=1 Tax=Synaphobranchus kaupii TaxID=118154 RepID=A0A9Q1F8N2_SYNKA|nr:hypothetical protein SKAU_G00208740 [Synaphobranchus kaupii]